MKVTKEAGAMKTYPSKVIPKPEDYQPPSEQAYEQYLALNKASRREDTTKPKPKP
jgi:hypothetical protein